MDNSPLSPEQMTKEQIEAYFGELRSVNEWMEFLGVKVKIPSGFGSETMTKELEEKFSSEKIPIQEFVGRGINSWLICNPLGFFVKNG